MIDLTRFAQHVIGANLLASPSSPHRRSLLGPLAVGAALAILSVYSGAAVAQSASRTANGIIAYLGLLPSEIVGQSSKGHVAETAHGGARSRKGSYHVVIALFDAQTNRRIEDARVKAQVAEFGLGGTEKELEPMNIAGVTTYGNYFNLRSPGVYRITVTVRRDGKTARFQFEQRR